MAETDIFNPLDWQAAGFAFNPNPSYGFERKMGANRQVQRPRLGIYPTRDVMNGGHIFSLAWINTDFTTAMRVVQFYHDFKDGYFTLIDPDWNQRQYVGKFMTEPNVGHPANAKYTFQGVVFEEMPEARMLVYPSLELYGHPINVVDDWLNPRVALMQGNWVIQVSPSAPGGSTLSTPSACEAYDAAGTAGDYAQVGYTGWGFQMTFRTAAGLGKVDISLDGALLLSGLDLSTGAVTGGTFAFSTRANSLAALAVPAPILSGFSVSPSVTVSFPSVPLDMHVVTVTAAGAGAGGGSSIIFPQLVYSY
jgi:hypothetical protein